MKNFGNEFNGKYLVVFNGNEVKCSFTFERAAVRAAIRYSVVKSRYVEVWYQTPDGNCELLQHWN